MIKETPNITTKQIAVRLAIRKRQAQRIIKNSKTQRKYILFLNIIRAMLGERLPYLR